MSGHHGDAEDRSYELRPATLEDLDFVCAARHRTLREHIDRAFGWDSTEQRAGYHELLSRREGSIIVVASEDVGFLHTGVEAGVTHLHEIVIVPEKQGRGLGTTIVRDVCLESDRSGLPVELAVLRGNTRAVALYERLGFEVCRESDATLWMTRSAP